MMGRWLRAIKNFVAPDLRGKIAALPDDKLLLLRDSIYRHPRGLKGYHIRMVTDEVARRGL